MVWYQAIGLMLGMIIAFMAVGSALVMPCLSALASRYSPPEAQGLVLGTLRSMGSLSRAVGPLVGGLLYWRFGSAVPYYLGALFLLVPLWLASGLPQGDGGSIAGRIDSAFSSQMPTMSASGCSSTLRSRSPICM